MEAYRAPMAPHSASFSDTRFGVPVCGKAGAVAVVVFPPVLWRFCSILSCRSQNHEDFPICYGRVRSPSFERFRFLRCVHQDQAN